MDIPLLTPEAFEALLREEGVNICKFDEIRAAEKRDGIVRKDGKPLTPEETLALSSVVTGEPPSEAIDQIHHGLQKKGVIKDSKCGREI